MIHTCYHSLLRFIKDINPTNKFILFFFFLAFTDKHSEIKKAAETIFFRYSELTDRPAAVKKSLDALSDLKAKVADWSEKMPQVPSE